MMTKTQQTDALADGLLKQVNQAAMDAAMELKIPTLVPPHKEDEKRGQIGKKQARSPLNGAPTPPGRPAGVKNKLTNLRDAVLEAFDRVGGADYLVRLAEGTQSDRAAFTGLVAKVLPTQINQNVEGGIKLELSWLGNRNIGTTQAQIAEPRTQVLDLEQDSSGGYRIKDPNTQTPRGGGTPGAAAPEAAGGAEGG